MDKIKIIDQINNNTYRTENGLTEDMFLFMSTLTPLINVDLFVTDKDNRLLLSWRDDVHCGTGWHIPGGIIRHGESIMHRLHACAIQELGADMKFDEQPVRISEIRLDQEERAHFISLLYRCRAADDYDIMSINGAADEHTPGFLKWFDNYPEEGIVYSQKVYHEYIAEWFNCKPRTMPCGQ